MISSFHKNSNFCRSQALDSACTDFCAIVFINYNYIVDEFCGGGSMI